MDKTIIKGGKIIHLRSPSVTVKDRNKIKTRRDEIQCARRASGINFLRYTQYQNIGKQNDLK